MPLILLIVSAIFVSVASANISVSGGGTLPINYVVLNKGIIMFDVDYSTSRIYFADGYLMVNKMDAFSSIGFSCETISANMTITKLSSDEITYTVNAETDVMSTTKIFLGSKGKPSEVSGGAWSYSSSLKVVTVTVLHRSPADIALIWDGDSFNDVARSRLVGSLGGNMDLLWLIVSLMAAGLMLSAIRGTPVNPVLLAELVVGTVIVYIGGVILLQFIIRIV